MTRRAVDPEIWRRAQAGHLGSWAGFAERGAAATERRPAAWRAILGEVERAAPIGPGERTLDIGGGLDTVLDFIPDARGYHVDSLAAKLEPFGLSPAARHVAGMIERLPFATGAFDRVFCMNVLDHVLSPAAGLGEIERVLAPGGVLVLSVDTFAGRRYWGRRLRTWWRTRVLGRRTKHPWVFSRRGLERLLGEAGFAILSSCHAEGTKDRRALFVLRRRA